MQFLIIKRRIKMKNDINETNTTKIVKTDKIK